MNTRHLLTPAVALLVASALTACNKNTGNVSIGATHLTHGGWNSEDVGAIAQGGSCSGEKLSVISWQNEFVGPTTLTPNEFVAAPGRATAKPPTSLTPPDPTGDPQVIALKNGHLVMTKIYYVGVQAQPPHPAPWTDEDQSAARKLYTYRALEEFLVSTDCGATWSNSPEVPWIDSASLPNKECQNPFWKPDRAAPLVYPGFDRGELIADPWTGALFFNTTCDGATVANGVETDAVYSARIWRLMPGDPAWTVVATPKWRAPGRVMTTTADGTLWMLQCPSPDSSNPKSGVPMVSVMPHAASEPTAALKNSPLKLSPPVNVSDAGDPAAPIASDRSVCAKSHLDWPNLAGGQNGDHATSWGISRATTNGVRIAYPRTTADGSVELVTAYIYGYDDGTADKKDPSFHIVSEHVITAAHSGDTLYMPAFIQRNDPQLQKNPANVAVLYWFESNPADNTARAWYSVVRAGADYTDPEPLEDGWTPKPNDSGRLGDYYNGAYACLGGETSFFPVWAESEKDATGPSADATAARIDTHDSCVEPELSASTPPTQHPPASYVTALPASTSNPAATPVPPTAASTSNPADTVPTTTTAAPFSSTAPPSSSAPPPPASSSTTQPTPAPTVTKVVDPTYQPPVDNQLYQCATVTVYGTHLAGATKVTLGGHDYAVSNVTDTTLNFTVPCTYTPTDIPQPFTVTTPNGTSSPITVTVNYFKP